MTQTPQEKRNKQIGVAISIGVHGVMLLVLFFMVAWRAPDPPLPEIGIELNVGLNNAGDGLEQPEPFTPPATIEQVEEVAPNGLDTPPEEVPEMVETEQVPEEPVTEPEPNEVTEDVINEVTTENTNDSPDVVKEIKETTQKEKPKEEKEPIKEDVKPKQPPVLYPNTKPGAGGKQGDNTSTNANHGDKPGTVGDQGDKEGSIDSRALYGKAGGGGGASLQMTGWMWDKKPNPRDNSSESGKLIFQVIIDDKGNIIRIKTIETSVSPSVEKLYKDEVQKLTFSRTTGGGDIPSQSAGIIIFNIKAK